jgi:DNA repair protein RadC
MFKLRKLPIRVWSENDRPREKLILKGRYALSDSELLAIILGSGSKNETAVDLAKRILQEQKNNLDILGKLDVPDLIRYCGVGEAKAVAIIAALELGRRRKMVGTEDQTIRSSRDSYEMMRFLQGLAHEEFWLLLLNRANKVIHKEQISRGGMHSTVVDSRIIFRTALIHKATGLILCHNHPSGACKPSQNDISLTQRLQKAASFLEMSILDHLIVGSNSYFSFADERLV